MGDIFNEKLIARMPDTKAYLMRAGIVLGAALIVIFSFLFLLPVPLVFPLLVSGALFGAYYLLKSTNIEYEYIVTNDEMDIDKVIGQSRRKHLLTVNCKTFDILAQAQGIYYNEYKDQTYDKVIDCSSYKNSPDRWFAVYSLEGKRYMLIFEPGEKMLAAFRTFIPRQIKL